VAGKESLFQPRPDTVLRGIQMATRVRRLQVAALFVS
jgi:hypothetical protein